MKHIGRELGDNVRQLKVLAPTFEELPMSLLAKIMQVTDALCDRAIKTLEDFPDEDLRPEQRLVMAETAVRLTREVAELHTTIATDRLKRLGVDAKLISGEAESDHRRTPIERLVEAYEPRK